MVLLELHEVFRSTNLDPPIMAAIYSITIIISNNLRVIIMAYTSFRPISLGKQVTMVVVVVVIIIISIVKAKIIIVRKITKNYFKGVDKNFMDLSRIISWRISIN